MKSVFLRLFFSIVAVTLVIILVQTGVVFLTNERMKEEWSQEVYQGYLLNVKGILESETPPEGWSIDTVGPALLRAADDRISGLLLHDNDGELVASFGKTHKGILLPVPVAATEDLDASARGKERGRTASTPIHTSVVVMTDVASDGTLTDIQVSQAPMMEVGSDMVVTTMTMVDAGKRFEKILPPDVTKQDVAGTVVLFADNEKIGTVDVLTFTPMTYKFTSNLVISYLKTFLITMPIALVISLLLGFVISRRSIRFSESISKALRRLADGEHDISLPKTKVKDYQTMVAAISHLDTRLQDHERARQAWLCSISHDLNTPVTSMKLLLDGMTDGVFPLDKQFVAMVKQENDLLQDRIKSVVTYSTLQSPDTVASTCDVQVLDLVDAVLRQFPVELASRVDVRIEVDTLVCDFSLMQTACVELVHNALAASDGSLVLWIVDRTDDGRYRMRFINDGQLPNFDIDFFEPWARGDVSRTSNGGSGLGLPIIGQVMKLHNGTAEIRSEEGKVIVTVLWS